MTGGSPITRGLVPSTAVRPTGRVLLGRRRGRGTRLTSVVENAGVRAAQRASPAGEPDRAARRAPARRRLSVDERREELIAAALELFGSHAADEISIDDVAERAGASRALVYHYFGSKQELYVAALRSAARQLTDLLKPPEDGKPLDRLSTSLSHYFDFVERHEAGFVALLRGAPLSRTGEVSEVVDAVRRLLAERVLHEFGVTRPQPVLRITMRAWISAVETAGLEWLESRDLPRKDLEALLVDHFVALLQTTARRDPQTAYLLKAATALQQ